MALSEIKITLALWDNMGSISDISLELIYFNSLWTSELDFAQEAWLKKRELGLYDIAELAENADTSISQRYTSAGVTWVSLI